MSSFHSIAQSEQRPDKGNVNFSTGTVLLYSTVSIGYESPDLLKKSVKHSLRPLVKFGVWNARVATNNVGSQCSIGLSYVIGSTSHHFEHSSEFVSHFDKGLKGQPIVYIASLYRPFVGYRYDSQNNTFIFKIGVGWKEVLQMGIGCKL
ncbi:MAG: hypothetical protein H0U95_13925 [Bacteroidetes bacterium]|nr:hypothetical protein [Bacteroidota bacterium]